MNEELKPCPYQTLTPPDNGNACKDRFYDECQCWNTEIVVSQLLNCPICGSQERDIVFHDCRTRYDVTCKDCGYSRKARWLGPIHHYTNDWNTRPIEDALRKEIADLKNPRAGTCPHMDACGYEALRAQLARKDEEIKALEALNAELEWRYEILWTLEWTWIRFEYCHCPKLKSNLDNAYSEIWATMIHADKGEVVAARARLAEVTP